MTAGVLERWPDVDDLVQQDVGGVPELPASRELADVREQLLGLEPSSATLVWINLLPSWLPSPRKPLICFCQVPPFLASVPPQAFPIEGRRKESQTLSDSQCFDT